MRLHLQRRIISGITLAAVLFGFAVPAFAVALQALDPVAYATICRVDDGSRDDGMQDRLRKAHCLLCLGAGSPPPAIPAAARPADFPEFRLPALQAGAGFDDAAALQPLNPRAPPRA